MDHPYVLVPSDDRRILWDIRVTCSCDRIIGSPGFALDGLAVLFFSTWTMGYMAGSSGFGSSILSMARPVTVAAGQLYKATILASLVSAPVQTCSGLRVPMGEDVVFISHCRCTVFPTCAARQTLLIRLRPPATPPAAARYFRHMLLPPVDDTGTLN